ncbi:hypothetical protein OS493_001664 [Desmophyllum pertusum]|uniref:Uncharacterized protein n=1 Tax=Desmophyllum pertusum TaxID=174260 RepID=A0A9W9ZHA1_9CNID|nr:hypothetical protein OS493_001664 [Desmophyllum pertusum]
MFLFSRRCVPDFSNSRQSFLTYGNINIMTIWEVHYAFCSVGDLNQAHRGMVTTRKLKWHPVAKANHLKSLADNAACATVHMALLEKSPNPKFLGSLFLA